MAGFFKKLFQGETAQEMQRAAAPPPIRQLQQENRIVPSIQQTPSVKISNDDMKKRKRLLTYIKVLQKNDDKLKSLTIKNTDPPEKKVLMYNTAKQILEKKQEDIKGFAPFFRVDPTQDPTLFQDILSKFEKVKEETTKMLETLQSLEEDYKKSKINVELFRQEKHLITPEQYKQRQATEASEVDKLQEEAKAIFQTRGPLCDSEGFYQHVGECWSDALQQVILNADGLKEVMQTRLITDTNIGSIQVPSHVFYPYFIKNQTPNKRKNFNEWARQEGMIEFQHQKQWVTIYLKEIQKRFLRHYVTEATRREYLATCSIDQPAEVAKKELQKISKLRRKAGKEGIDTAILGKLGRFNYITDKNKNRLKSQQGFATLSPEEYRTSESYAGGTAADIIIILNVINHVYFENEILLEYVAVNEIPSIQQLKQTIGETMDRSRPTGLLIAVNMFNTEGERTAGHQLALYTCGGKNFFYDNNAGVFPFAWREFISTYVTTPAVQLRFISFSYSKGKSFYQTAFYPVITSIKEGKSYYTTFVSSEKVEFIGGDYTKEEGDTKFTFIAKGSKHILKYIMFLSPPSQEDVKNLAYQHQLNARLAYRRYTQEDLDKAFKKKDEDEVLDILEGIDLSKTNTKNIFVKKNDDFVSIVLLSVIMGMERVTQKLIDLGISTTSLSNLFVQLMQEEATDRKETDANDALAAKLLEYIRIPPDFTIPDSNGEPDPVLSVAVWKGYSSVVTELVHQGIDSSQFPIFLFIGIGAPPEFFNGLQALVNIGYNLNSQDPETGWTPLMMAANKGDNDFVKFLLYNKASMSTRDPVGMYAIHTACISGQEKDTSKVVSLLLKAGANINAKTLEGATPLALATRYAHPNVVKLLCSRGAIASANGKDPWDKNIINTSNVCAAKGGRRFRKTQKRKYRKHTSTRRH